MLNFSCFVKPFINANQQVTMSKFKAALFDLDGTLIDSEFFHYECWNEILQDTGSQLTYEDWLKNYAGVPLPTNAKNLAAKYGITTPLDEVIERRENLTLERLNTKDVNLMPHVVELLDLLKDKAVIIALVTSSPRKDVEAILNRNGLGKYFKLIITRTEVKLSKPDPESYNVCREQLGLQPQDCLVFEDTINGIRSAKAAGLTCYAIQTNTADHEKLAIADRIFLDLADAEKYLLDHDLI